MRRLLVLAGFSLCMAGLAEAMPRAAPDCAHAAPAALADTFEQAWLAGRLHAADAGVCIDRLRERDGETVANALRELRRLGASGAVDAAMPRAFAIAARNDLAAAERVEAGVTLAELLFWRDRLGDVRRHLGNDPHDVAGPHVRLRWLFSRARLEGLSHDVPACIAAADAAMAHVDARFREVAGARAIALLAVGTCQRLAGDHGSSIASFGRARELEVALGDAVNHSVAAQTLVLIGQGWKISGDYARAERGYDEALAYLRAHPEPLPVQLGSLLHGMANLDRDSGDRARLERSLLRYAESERLMARAYGADSLRISQVSNNHGNALGRLGRYDEAAAAYARALAIVERLGKDADATSLMPPISNAALVRLWQKRYADAEAGFRRGLALVENQPAGSESNSMFSRLGIAAALWGQGQHAQAYGEAERAERDRQLALAVALANMSDASAIRYQEVQWPSLDMVIAIAHASADPALVERAWALAMAARGQVSLGIAARLAQARSSTDPRLRARFEAWKQQYQRVTGLRMQASADRSALLAGEDALDQAARTLAEAMPAAAHEIAGADVTTASLQPVLDKLDASLAGFMSSAIRSPDEYRRGDVGSRPRDVYAFVARPGHAVGLLRLADERVFSAAVDGWRAAAGDPQVPAVQVARAGQRLRRLVFDPLGVAEDGLLLLVPYGELHELNLAALPDRDGYLIERGLRVHTLYHERDLLRAAMPEPAALRVLAVSDPAFTRGVDGDADTARTDACDASGWRALPGSRREVAALERVLPDSARLTDLHGAAAERTRVLAALPSQDIIHIATHALRRDRECAGPAALAATRGATLAVPSAESAAGDGGVGVLILSRAGRGNDDLNEADITALALEQARWVVLSACDTGLGDSRAYEGAFGLRRAFQLAGARSVIMSLWRIDDIATADWMTALYDARFEHSASTVEAVARAQRVTLAARRAAGQSAHPYYWAGFIAAGDWR